MNIKLGYYDVNGLRFYNKLQAILYANQTKADITWVFGTEKTNSAQWTVEPPVSLDFLYAERARQIREEFDYVILMCSGGADSTNMLYSFLNNNIRIDEIIAGAPLSGLSNWVPTADTSANNTISETMYAQLPLMKKISISNPNIRITIHDYFEDMLKLKTDEWIYEASAHWIHFSGATRHSLDKFSHIKDLAESGKKIGVIYGIDKPIIYRAKSGNLYSIVTDAVVNIVTPHFKEKYPNVESVLFYFAVDFPELMIKQAHEVCRYMSFPNNSPKKYLWDDEKGHSFNADPLRASNWQREIVPCIYPSIYSFQKDVWQANKQSPGFRGGFQIDNWVLQLHGNEMFVQMIKSDLNLFLGNIDRKYFLTDNKEDGFSRFLKHWFVGHESQFLQQFNGDTVSNIDTSKFKIMG